MSFVSVPDSAPQIRRACLHGGCQQEVVARADDAVGYESRHSSRGLGKIVVCKFSLRSPLVPVLPIGSLVKSCRG